MIPRATAGRGGGHSPPGAALRTAMTADLRHRYADRPDDPIHLPPAQALAPTSMAWTGVA